MRGWRVTLGKEFDERVKGRERRKTKGVRNIDLVCRNSFSILNVMQDEINNKECIRYEQIEEDIDDTFRLLCERLALKEEEDFEVRIDNYANDWFERINRCLSDTFRVLNERLELMEEVDFEVGIDTYVNDWFGNFNQDSADSKEEL